MGYMKDLAIKLDEGAYSSLSHAERVYLISIGEPAPGRCRCSGCVAKRAEPNTPWESIYTDEPCECPECTEHRRRIGLNVHGNRVPDDAAILARNEGF